MKKVFKKVWVLFIPLVVIKCVMNAREVKKATEWKIKHLEHRECVPVTKKEL